MRVHPIFTNAEAKAIDRLSTEDLGIPEISLMGSAALAVFHANEDLWETAETILILVGTGGNGGDGYALAQILFQEGHSVQVFQTAPNKNQAGIFYESLCRKVGIQIGSIGELSVYLNTKTKDSILLVDALLGIGFTPPLDEHLTSIIELCNQKKEIFYTISLDTPSGFISGMDSISVQADSIEELGTRKWENIGYQNPDSEEPTPRYYESIGFPVRSHISKINFQQKFIWEPDQKLARDKLKRKLNAHKYKSGSAMFYGGKEGMEGAILLSEKTFSVLGGGITKIGSPSLAIQKLTLAKDLSRMAQSVSFSEFIQDSFLEKVSVLVCGPGLTENPVDFSSNLDLGNKTLILDAGAIPKSKEKVPNSREILLTPHMGEFSKLTNKSYIRIQDVVDDIRKLCSEWQVNILVKSHISLYCTKSEECFVFESPNPKLATMGTGDLLTGVIARYLSTGETLTESVYLALSLLDGVRQMEISNPTAGNILEFLKGVV